jgi:hypothetical protein
VGQIDAIDKLRNKFLTKIRNEEKISVAEAEQFGSSYVIRAQLEIEKERLRAGKNRLIL